jgi:hypothetical protein
MYIPTIKYESQEQFTTAMSEHAHDIHMRTLYGIENAFNTDNDYVIIAYLETDNAVAELGVPDDVWIDNLEKSLDYFEEIEDYTKCQEVVQLIKKLKK